MQDTNTITSAEPLTEAATQPPTAAVTDAKDTGGMTANWKYRLVVLQHHHNVYRLACALLRDDREAEDVTQEAFTRYWLRGAEVKRPREWLLTVARNACLDRLRVAGRFLSDTHASVSEPQEHRDPEWHYQQSELSSRLNNLIDSLPEPQRSLIVLFDIQGMSGAQCARILDLSANQVKVYLHRARRRLRLKLEASA